MNSLTALLCAMAALTFLGCASAPPMDRAIAVHNVYRSILLDLDSAYAPVLSEANATAVQQHADDFNAYQDSMRPYFSVVQAMTVARQAEQAISVAIKQWEATGKDSGVLRETYACAATAVDTVSMALGTLPKASPLYAAAFAVSTQLRQMAEGEECTVKK